MKFTDLVKVIKEYNKKADFDLIRKAYTFAKKAHKGKKRKTGESYLQHLLETAHILAKLKLDEKTIIAALLHDTVEDTNIKINDLEKEFSKEIASLVSGVTKINIFTKKDLEKNNAASIRKMLIASTKDIRVILIKLADRLHNMHTLYALNKEDIRRISRETLDIYAPIAYRLGLANIKWKLEDLAFKYLEPEIYKTFKYKVARKRKQREKDIENLIKIIKKELTKNKIKAEISGRPKHFYSIYKKMKLKNIGFDRIYDLLGLRIITENDTKKCYEVLGIIHNLWKPLFKEFEDYIAIPKPNMYQSLHTVVIAPKKQLIEIQIKTKKMNDIAEEGIAAHWYYKGIIGDKKFDKQLSWLKQIYDFGKDTSIDFMEALKIDLFSDNIFCFTPKGEIIELPRNSTPIDFAYSIHSDIGEKCSGARVNDKFVSLRYKLKTGDKVEILTSKLHKPSRDWLTFVKTHKAISKIKCSLKAKNGISTKKIKKIKKDENRNIIEIEGIRNKDIEIADCCNPLPGDEILGFTSTKKITIHNKNCSNINKIKRPKVKVNWIDNLNSLVKLKINALDRVGLLADILNTIAAANTDVKLTNAKTLDNQNAECILNIKSNNLKHLRTIINRINKIADVKKVKLES